MARDSELNALRARVRQEHRRATAKASRLRAKGVEVTGTNYDPRRNLSNIKKYNRKQLESYSAQLSAFNSRSTSFEAGQGGAILPGAEVRRYRQVENKFNRIARKQYGKIADIPAFGRGMSIREADRLDRPSMRTRMGGMSVTRPYEETKRSMRGVTGPDALRQLTEDMERRLSKGYLPSKLSEQRRQFMAMMTEIGHIESVRDANKLTDEQFNVLFNYNTSILDEITRDYGFIKLRAQGTEEEFQSRIHEKAIDRISNAIKWAGQLDI